MGTSSDAVLSAPFIAAMLPSHHVVRQRPSTNRSASLTATASSNVVTTTPPTTATAPSGPPATTAAAATATRLLTIKGRVRPIRVTPLNAAEAHSNINVSSSSSFPTFLFFFFFFSKNNDHLRLIEGYSGGFRDLAPRRVAVSGRKGATSSS